MRPLSNDRTAFNGKPRSEPSLALDGRPVASAKPKLLVSVRDAAEIAAATRCGVDIVDFKEPRRGPLAPADVELWLHAASLWSQLDSGQPQPWLSAALGERPEAVRIAAQLPAEFAFAKVGPSRCDEVGKVREMWAEVRQLLDPRTELVAVAYADYRSADCIHPEAVFKTAIEAGFRRCLIDTFVKDGQSTIDHLGFAGLLRLQNVAQEGGLWWALAGSINVACVSQLRQRDLLPDCFGVRGDVCNQGRGGTLSQDRIQLWKDRIAELRAADHDGR